MQAGSPPSARPPAETGRMLVGIATYNERDNLKPLIDEIHTYVPHADVLVVDDNSPDGTGAAADALAAADPRVRVLHRAGKQGLGTALLAALKYGVARGYDFVQIMDADFSHPPRYLPGIHAGMAARDVMIGSRYVPGGGTENWPASRLWISRSVNGLVRGLFRMPVRDASGGFRCYRVSLLERVDLDGIRSRGYSFQQEVLFRCFQAGASLGEHPIMFENRRAGASKVSIGESVRSLSMLLYLGARYTLGLERRKRRGG